MSKADRTKERWDLEEKNLITTLRSRKAESERTSTDAMGGQPSEGGWCYMTSLINEDCQMFTGGRVMAMSLHLAGLKVVQRTHRLAEANEITTFLTNSRRVYDQMLAFEEAKKGRQTVTVEALPPSPKVGKQ